MDTVIEKIDNLTFGEATKLMKNGFCLARAGWNGSGLFVFKQVHADVPHRIIPSMQSLPEQVKSKLAPREADLKYRNQFCIVYPDNSIYGWVASPSDISEEDWLIVD